MSLAINSINDYKDYLYGYSTALNIVKDITLIKHDPA